ncbi:MAG: hypothetical protein ACRDJP_09035 [Actinomycetota bacterium]
MSELEAHGGEAGAAPTLLGAAAPEKRVAGLTWVMVFCGVAGGFFVGGVVSGKIELSVEEISTFIEIAVAVPTLIPGTFALARVMGKHVRLSAAVRYGLAVSCLASGLMLGLTMSAEEGTADDRVWLQSAGGRLSLALLGVSLLTALVISLRRYPLAGPPAPEPTLEQQLYGPNA